MVHHPVLIVHGSSDPRYERAIARLRQRLQQEQASGLGLPLLCLENQTSSLVQQLEALLLQEERASWQLYPLFLLEGVHVREDLPAALEQVTQRHRDLQVRFADPLGSSAVFFHWLQTWLAKQPEASWVFVTHGSRLPQAQTALLRCAQQFHAPLVAWTQAGTLEQTLDQSYRSGCRALRILPLFLFPGALPAKLGHQLCHWHWQHPDVCLRLAPVLSGLPGFVPMLARWTSSA
jgi:sirohydrochlorin ferrochelatase